MPDPVPYRIFDADNHLYETEDALTRHLPEQYAGAIQYVQIKGRTKIAVLGKISEYIPNPTFDVVARPGAMEEYFRVGNPEGKSYRALIGDPMRSVPGFRSPEPRLQIMDELGIERTLMFPTLASLIEERMREFPELIMAVTHALNQWIFEEWNFNYQDRIYTTPVISLPIVDDAIRELEWVVERGARAVLIRPAPVPGLHGPRSFALPEFDPFWEKVAESGVLVAMHSSDSGYARYAGEWEGAQNEMLPFKPTPFPMIGEWRPVTDAVASWVCHGALFRHPTLKIAVIENGSAWVAPLMAQLADLYKKQPHGFLGDPVQAVRDSIHVSPFYEEDLSELTDLIGVERVLFGSDYPHPEGLAHPSTYLDALASLGEEEKVKIMGGNLSRLIPV
jgi:predicted TIM-barrel fold metal-dependent hydrolase